jgi:hypothetical protein
MYITPTSLHDALVNKLMKGNLKDVVKCDFEAVNICPNRKYSPLSVMIILFMVLLVLFQLSAAFGLQSFNFLLILVMFPTWMWWVYGYTPSCMPMVPACIMQDALYAARQILPVGIEWPDALQTTAGCANNNQTAHCLRSCLQEPFLFNSWSSSVVWIVCSMDMYQVFAATFFVVPGKTI